MDNGIVIDKDLARIILNMRWDLKHRRIPRRKWRSRIFEHLWGDGSLKGKPTDTFVNCWNYLVEEKLI